MDSEKGFFQDSGNMSVDKGIVDELYQIVQQSFCTSRGRGILGLQDKARLCAYLFNSLSHFKESSLYILNMFIRSSFSQETT